MQRKRRTTILVKGSMELARTLAEEILERYQVQIIQEPQQGLVMVKMRDQSQHTLFYIGEVLITECKVQIEDTIGLGIIQEQNPQKAYYLAIIDSAYNANLFETKAWEELLIREEKKNQELEEQERLQILKTKVDFTTMSL
ncbi:phosphonate C-P lyase system protein PhnG [Heliorestis acidaminivorans]|uniref:Phosphonate C-P lyase system protein PhnG n=1 Tax=Heliorestis acidaminivorans TaxID=553427 RepID=A0A6I0EYH2_9FIRM|nr:phosphonate C-P lyase system protein PhnG [Heliorestis acidaminivorans]KAB2953461.1 phosphonate C-P lyase system protein PhnG [Heliorestis acidaminivorans]